MEQLTGIAASYLSLTVLKLILGVVLGLPAVYLLSRWLERAVARRYRPHWGMLLGKIAFHGGWVFLALAMLNEAGISMAPLLGAAGVVGVALGFASQTSISNVISGLFLIAEQSFQVGHLIKVGTATGVVLSIDTLSVKIRTFDNKYIRLPNETLLKSEVVNFSQFPIRRIDLRVPVAYKEDLRKVESVLLTVADRNPYSLHEPEPLVLIDCFAASSIDFQLGIWVLQDDFVEAKNSIHYDIKEAFKAEGIELPLPQLSLYGGPVGTPLTVKLESGADPAA